MAACCVLAAAAVSAWATWSAASVATSHGAAVAATVSQGATPTATASPGRTVAVSWGASTLSNGQAVAGYLVKRYISGGALQTTLAGCSGTITATTCTESDVPAGVWQYTVTPVIGTNWQGVESLESGGVTVAPATLTLGRTLFGAPLPQTTTGSITGFAASEGVGYRLDGATTLTGSPSTVSSAGAATISSLTIPSGTADGAHTVYALGTTSPFASQASVGIVTDTTPPTVSASLSPAANAAGWNRVSPVIVTLSANDGTGSGVAAITYTTDGSDPTTSGTAHVYSTAISVSTNTTIRYFATDSAGNSSATQTQPVEIDAIAPTNVIGLSSVTGGAALSGMTIYYRGSAAGSLALTNAVTDTGGSGPASSGTAALSGTSTGFSHTSSLVATPAGGPYVSNPLIWSAGTTSSPTETVTGSDVASNTATTPLSFVDDVTPPTGGVLSVNATAATGGGSSSYDTAASFTIGPRTDYTDATSGLASSTLTLATAALSGGTCAGFGTPTTITDSPTQSATAATCYQYTLTGTDNVGNTAAISTIVKVDTTAPSAPTITLSGATGNTFINGATVYTNPQAGRTGGFTATPTTSDAESGIQSVAFPSLSGYTSGGGTILGSPYATTYAWSGSGATASGSQAVTATDNAGLTATTTSAFTITPDTTPPVGGLLSVNATAATGGGSSSYDTASSFTIGTRTDYTDSGSGLASSTLTVATATLSGGTCASFGTPTTITGSPTQAATTATCYQYALTGTDDVGNTAAISTIVKVDTTAPSAPTIILAGATGNTFITGSTVYTNPQAGKTGGFTATPTTSDAESGIQSVAFPSLTGYTSGGGTIPGSPYATTYAWSGSGATGSGGQAVTATDNAGLTATTTSAFIVTPDTTPPTGGVLSVNATAATGGGSSSYDTAASFTIGPRTDYTDGTSGLASSALTLATAALSGGTCAGFGTPTTITGSPTQSATGATCYQYTLTGTDNVGNTAAISTIVKVDTTAPSPPTITLSGATGNTFINGATVYTNPQTGNSGGFTATATSADSESGIQGITFPTLAGFTGGGGTTTSSPYTTTYAWPAAATASGPQTVTATDNAGLTDTNTFTVTPDTAPPTGGTVTYAGGYNTSGSVSVGFTPGADAGAGLNASSGLLQRASATLAAGACGSFGAFATVASNQSSPYADTGGTSGNCYEYRYVISDAVGNQATYTSASVVKLDTQAPSQSLSLASPVAAILSGTTLYYNGALTGSFSLLDTLADPLSGVGSATFPGIATTGWTHAAQTVSTPTGGPFTSSGFAWTASPGNPGSYVVSGLDNAGNTGTATITFASDTTAPAGGSVAYANGVVNALSVSIATSTGSDAQSQVNAAAASVVRAVATLTTLTESCGSFSSFSAVTLVSGADTSVASGHCYKYEYLVPDNVGNQATYTSGSVAEVDTSGPQVTAIVSQESGGGTGVGKLAVGTKLILTFNQLLATGSVPTSFTGASENRAATLSGVLIPQDVTLTIPGITQAAVDTGSSAYFSGLCVLLCSAQSATFDGTVGNTNNGTVTTLTLTVTSVTPGSGSTLGTSSGGLIFTPATSLKDGGGNAASGSFNTAGSFKLF